MGKRKAQLKYQNKKLKCKCVIGRCPNYDSKICGEGGKIVFDEFGYDKILEKMKKVLNHDEYIGTNGYYKRAYKKKLQEKKNVKK